MPKIRNNKADRVTQRSNLKASVPTISNNGKAIRAARMDAAKKYMMKKTLAFIRN